MAKTNYQDEVHYIAEKFLQEYTEMQANTFTTQALEQTEEKVVIVRDTIPEYFCALKASGQAVWSHDVRFAKVVSLVEANGWLESLMRHGFKVRAEVLS